MLSTRDFEYTAHEIEDREDPRDYQTQRPSQFESRRRPNYTRRVRPVRLGMNRRRNRRF